MAESPRMIFAPEGAQASETGMEGSTCEWGTTITEYAKNRHVLSSEELEGDTWKVVVEAAKDNGFEKPADVLDLLVTPEGKTSILQIFKQANLKDKWNLRVENLASRLVNQIATDLKPPSEEVASKPPKKEERPLPELTDADIQGLFEKSWISIPSIDLIGGRDLFRKLIRDKREAEALGNNLTPVDLLRECAPFDERTEAEPEDVIERLRAALSREIGEEVAEANPAGKKRKKEFRGVEDFVRHYLVWAYAASACGQMNMTTALNHLSNVMSVASEHGKEVAFMYDARRRNIMSQECTRDRSFDPKKELGKFAEADVQRILHKISPRKRVANASEERSTPQQQTKRPAGRGKSRQQWSRGSNDWSGRSSSSRWSEDKDWEWKNGRWHRRSDPKSG